jgi:transketolase
MFKLNEKTMSLREALGKAMVEIGEEYENVLAINADLVNSVKTTYFHDRFPERFIEVGIAEQNMMGMAAGFSLTGFIPFVFSFGVFATKRAADQLSISIAYPKNNVKIIGAYSGLFTGGQGATQQSIDDLASMRALPNMRVIDTADPYEIYGALKYAAEYDGPVYIRVGRDEWPVVFDNTYKFPEEKALWLKEGKDVTIINTGILLNNCYEALKLLKEKGINAGLLHIPMVKPIDEKEIIKAAKETGAIVTVENHNIIGGLGSAVAEVVTTNDPVPVERVGIPDVFGESAPNQDLMEKYGLAPHHIVEAVESVLTKKLNKGN